MESWFHERHIPAQSVIRFSTLMICIWYGALAPHMHAVCWQCDIHNGTISKFWDILVYLFVCMSVCTKWDDFKISTVSCCKHIACNPYYTLDVIDSPRWKKDIEIRIPRIRVCPPLGFKSEWGEGGRGVSAKLEVEKGRKDVSLTAFSPCGKKHREKVH